VQEKRCQLMRLWYNVAMRLSKSAVKYSVNHAKPTCVLCFTDQTHKDGPKLRVHMLQAGSISTQLLCCCNGCRVGSVECIEQRQCRVLTNTPSDAFATATKTRIRKCWSKCGSKMVEEQLDCIISAEAPLL
jgi:hypothetical protein